MTQLLEPFEMAMPSLLQHLQVLEASGLVSSKKSGRTRVFQLEPAKFAEAEVWLDSVKRHWNKRLDQLDAFIESQKETPS